MENYTLKATTLQAGNSHNAYGSGSVHSDHFDIEISSGEI